jgi:hypothetical protein
VLDFEAEILNLYGSACDFTDAVIVLAFPQEIVYWPESAIKYFGYSERAAIGQNASLIFPDGMMQDLIDAEFTRQSDAAIAHKELQGKRVAHGSLLEIKTSKGTEIKAKCSLYPLLINEVLHLVLFFGIESDHSEAFNIESSNASNSPFSSNNPFIFGAQWVLFLWKTQPVLFVILVFLGLGGLGIWKAEGLGKAIKEIMPIARPKPEVKDGTIIDTDKDGNRTIRFGGR